MQYPNISLLLFLKTLVFFWFNSSVLCPFFFFFFIPNKHSLNIREEYKVQLDEQVKPKQLKQSPKSHLYHNEVGFSLHRWTRKQVVV